MKKNEVRAYISNVEEAILEYYIVFAKQIKVLPPGTSIIKLLPSIGRTKKIVDYYLLKWVQVCQHMLLIKSINKR